MSSNPLLRPYPTGFSIVFDAGTREESEKDARLNFPRELKIGLPLFDLARASA